MRTELNAVIRKEFRQIFRDRRLAVVLILAPVIQLTLLGYAVDLEVDRIPTAVIDQDDTPESRALIRGLFADRTLEETARTRDPDQPLGEGSAQVVIVLPPGLEKNLQHGRSSEIQLLIDGTDPIRGQSATDAALSYFQGQSVELATRRFEQISAAANTPIAIPRVRAVPRILYNPEMRSPVYMVPGVAAVVLLVVTTISTAMSIAKERELGTIEQLLVTPMQPATLLFGKILPFAVIGVVVAGLVLAVGTNLFDVPVRGPISVLFFGTTFYLLSTLGSGVFISTVAKTQQQAILGGFFFIMPAIYLSGFMSPIENMPSWIQPLTWINPMRYYVEILRACLLKGAGFSDLWQQLAALVTFGAAIFGLSSMRFRKRLS
jgi:ABC-2 type transport system permease protein